MTGEPGIICHSQFKYGCGVDSCWESVLYWTKPGLIQVEVEAVESNSYIY